MTEGEVETFINFKEKSQGHCPSKKDSGHFRLYVSHLSFLRGANRGSESRNVQAISLLGQKLVREPETQQTHDGVWRRPWRHSKPMTETPETQQSCDPWQGT